jgi:hypothetical protein
MGSSRSVTMARGSEEQQQFPATLYVKLNLCDCPDDVVVVQG